MHLILILIFLLLTLYFKFKKNEKIDIIPKNNQKKIIKIFSKKADKINYLKYCLTISLNKYFLKLNFNFQIEKSIKYDYCLFYLNYLVENFINNDLILYEEEIDYFKKNLLNFSKKFIFEFNKALFKFENKIIIQSYTYLTKKNKTKKKLKIDQKLLKEIFKLMSEIIYFDLIRYETFFNQNKLKKKIKILIKNYYLN